MQELLRKIINNRTEVKHYTQERPRKLFFFLLLFTIILIAIGCKKEDDLIKNCGCEGPIQFTIENNENHKNGFLFERTSFDTPNTPNFEFGIYVNDGDCSNCIHYYLICNEQYLSNLGNIPPYPGVEVSFSGLIKGLCEGISSPADHTYSHIVITKIEK